MSQPEIINFSFCQLSDLRLDSDASLELHLSPAQRKQRNEEAIASLDQAMKVASSNDLDAILVPGNLFDSEHLRSSTIQAVQQIFARLQDLPVFICPGALDPLGADSPYNQSALQARGLAQWSSNVKIFTEELERISLPGLEFVNISGLGLSRENRKQSPLPGSVSDPERAALNLLMLPLGLDELDNEKASRNLISALGKCNYSYIALSGYKQIQKILLAAASENSEEARLASMQQTLVSENYLNPDESKQRLAMASGTFCGQSKQETGPRAAIFANLTLNPDGATDTFIDIKEFDKRRIVKLEFDLSLKNPDTVKVEFASELIKSKIREALDILILELSGFYQEGHKPEIVDDKLKKSFYHLRLHDRSRADSLQRVSNKNLIESTFVRLMNELKESEIEAAAEPERLLQIENGLYFGLEALRQSRVTISNAD